MTSEIPRIPISRFLAALTTSKELKSLSKRLKTYLQTPEASAVVTLLKDAITAPENSEAFASAWFHFARVFMEFDGESRFKYLRVHGDPQQSHELPYMPDGCMVTPGVFNAYQHAYYKAAAISDDDESEVHPSKRQRIDGPNPSTATACNEATSPLSNSSAVPPHPSKAPTVRPALSEEALGELVPWSQVAIPFRLHPENPLDPTSFRLDITSKALAEDMADIRSALGHTTHLFGCLVRGDYFELWYVDANRVDRSSSLKITKNILKLATVLAVLGRATKATLGFDPAFQPPEGVDHESLPRSLVGWYYNVPTKFCVRITKLITVQWGLSGRGTAVYEVEWEGRKAALKASSPQVSQPREVDLFQRARDTLESSLPRRPLGVPEVFAESQGELISLGFRRLLPPPRSKDRSVDRRKEIIVMERLYPLHTLAPPEYVAPLMDIITTLYHLSLHGIVHRDVSTNNFLIRQNTDGSEPFGVLIDFDHSVDHNNPMPGDAEPWGTLPFYAVDLQHCAARETVLQPIFRFDLESCFYVFLYDALRYPNGKPEGYTFQSCTALDFLEDPDGFAVLRYKTRLPLELVLTNSDFLGVSPFIDEILPRLAEIARMLYDGRKAIYCRGPDPDVNEGWLTMAGHFTYEKVLEVFRCLRDDLRMKFRQPETATEAPVDTPPDTPTIV